MPSTAESSCQETESSCQESSCLEKACELRVALTLPCQHKTLPCQHASSQCISLQGSFCTK
eukprot:1644602-Rhodomonas_salina.4